MTTLTDKQVKELTARINGRLQEFEAGLRTLSPGIVRLVESVIDEWWQERDEEEYREMREGRDPDRQESIDTYALTDAYGYGYERGREAMRRELLGDKVDEGRLVTNCAPEPDDDAPPKDDKKLTWQDLSGDEAIANDDGDNSAALGTNDVSVVVTPLHSPIGAGRVPDPNTARANVAAMLAQANGEHGFDLTPGSKRMSKAEQKTRALNQAKGRKGNVLPTREQMVALIKEIAMGNVAPTMSSFNIAKPSNWASAAAQIQRLGVRWGDLCQEAGLAPNPRGRE